MDSGVSTWVKIISFHEMYWHSICSYRSWGFGLDLKLFPQLKIDTFDADTWIEVFSSTKLFNDSLKILLLLFSTKVEICGQAKIFLDKYDFTFEVDNDTPRSALC